MLLTLVPFFDKSMTIQAYSFFSQRENNLLKPSLQNTSSYDGAVNLLAFDVIDRIGLDSLSGEKAVFVPVNNISILADINSQCSTSHSKIILLLDDTIQPTEQYLNRITELKLNGYRMAVRKTPIEQYEKYSVLFKQMDYILLDSVKIDLTRATLFFKKVFPHVKLIAGNIKTTQLFDRLVTDGGYDMYEGEFFRVPINKGDHEVSPLKANHIRLLNIVNDTDFDLSMAADIVGQDTALVISLLKMVNRIGIISEITSIRHATAMLGQKELRKWITTAVTNQMYSDKPNEITRISLIRAKFAETLAPLFQMAPHASELFLTGIFSVLDIVLNMPMEKALDMVTVSKDVRDALTHNSGKLFPVYNFVKHYEIADWQEVCRLLIIHDISVTQVYNVYIETLLWYSSLFKA